MRRVANPMVIAELFKKPLVWDIQSCELLVVFCGRKRGMNGKSRTSLAAPGPGAAKEVRDNGNSNN